MRPDASKEEPPVETGDAQRTPPESGETQQGPSELNRLGIASLAVSSTGFLTMLKMADRRTRTPARALLLFLATTLEFASGILLGARALQQIGDPDRHERGVLPAAAGIVIGVVTSLLTFNWMRTKRRM